MAQRLCTIHSDCATVGATMSAACWRTQWAALPWAERKRLMDYVSNDGVPALDALTRTHMDAAVRSGLFGAEEIFLREVVAEYAEPLAEEYAAIACVNALAKLLELCGHRSYTSHTEMIGAALMQATSAVHGTEVFLPELIRPGQACTWSSITYRSLENHLFRLVLPRATAHLLHVEFVRLGTLEVVGDMPGYVFADDSCGISVRGTVYPGYSISVRLRNLSSEALHASAILLAMRT